MFKELLGRSLQKGDIVAYPSGSGWLDFAVITTTVPPHSYEVNPRSQEIDMVPGAQTLGAMALIYGKKPYALRRYDLVNRRWEYKELRMRTVHLHRTVMKVSYDEIRDSLLGADMKRILIDYSMKMQEQG